RIYGLYRSQRHYPPGPCASSDTSYVLPKAVVEGGYHHRVRRGPMTAFTSPAPPGTDRNMQFKRRQLLILLLAGSQLLCLTVGVLWAARWLHKTYTQCITENAAAESESIAFELVRRLDSAGLKSIAPGSEGWHKLQP